MSSVTKSIITDFSDKLRSSEFHLRLADVLSAKFLSLSSEDDTLSINFSSSLDAGETTILNDEITAHIAAAPPAGFTKNELMDSVPGFAGCEISRNTCDYAGNDYDDTGYYETASIAANVWTPISAWDFCETIGPQVSISGGTLTIKKRGLYFYSLYTSCQVEGKKEAVLECGLKINQVNPSDGDSKTLAGSDIKSDKHLVSMSGSTAFVLEEGDTIQVVFRYIKPTGSNKIRLPILRFSVIKM